jgi:RNA-directed DNA polymerase
MACLSRFLSVKLKLRMRPRAPWTGPGGGKSCWHKRPRLKMAPTSLTRFKDKLRERLRGGRGRKLRRQVQELSPLLRDWVNYFRLAEVKGVFEALDGWLRRKLRGILWRQWNRSYTHARNLMKHGLGEERAWKSAINGRDPWWNAGASHMNEALPKRFLDNLRLVSLLDYLCLTQGASGPPCTEPFARWCERTGAVRPPPTR